MVLKSKAWDNYKSANEHTVCKVLIYKSNNKGDGAEVDQSSVCILTKLTWYRLGWFKMLIMNPKLTTKKITKTYKEKGMKR